MFLENFITELSEYMSVSKEIAGFTMASIFTLSIVLAIMIATKGKDSEMPTIVTTITMFTMCWLFGWIPFGVLAAILLVVAVLGGVYFSKVARTGGD